MSSKLRKLKQLAYEAGRKRDWPAAADAYAQIMEQDKSNPALQNEYGDACLKMGDVSKALRQFLSAASKYRQNGLLNNAQAVYKKVLRHEPTNLNANWYLAEIRSAQGLLVEGAKYAMVFLAAAEEVSGEIKEIFLKRCLELFGFYPETDEILERLEGIFRIWNMPMETVRAGCLRACLVHQNGDPEGAAAAVAKMVAAVPEITNYAEYTRWLEQNGQKKASAVFSDVNAINLDATTPPDEAVVPDSSGKHAPPASSESPAMNPALDIDSRCPPDSAPMSKPETPLAVKETMSAFEEFLALGNEQSSKHADLLPDAPAPTPSINGDIERDEEGCITIDTGTETSFADILKEALSDLSSEPAPVGNVHGQSHETQGSSAGQETNAPAFTSGLASGSVNLLEEILAEEGQDIVRSSEIEQVSTIASEIGRNFCASADADPEAQYQQGLVYLEMGLYDQAVVAFSTAARHPSCRLRASEMLGVSLKRAGHAEAALQALLEGLADSGDHDRQSLGLRYHAGRILEELGRMEEAQAYYRQIHACDAGFADVIRRLRVPVCLETPK